jgi:hypothetical protein
MLGTEHYNLSALFAYPDGGHLLQLYWLLLFDRWREKTSKKSRPFDAIYGNRSRLVGRFRRILMAACSTTSFQRWPWFRSNVLRRQRPESSG